MDSDTHVGKRRKIQLPSMIGINEAQYKTFEQEYAERYIMKLKSRLDKSSFSRIVSILLEINKEEGNVINHSKDVSRILQFCPDLEMEFLTFLYPSQAAERGRLTDYLQLHHIKEFLFKLNLCYKENPQQIRKIMNAVSRLSSGIDVTADMMRITIVPLLKNNYFLIDSFLRLIPQEKPPESLFSDNWEEIDMYSTEPITDEVIHVSKLKNRSLDGNDDNNCINCVSHKSDGCQNRNFVNGKLFIPNGKMLKPAKNVTENVVTDQATSTMKVLQKEENVRNAKGNKKLTGNNFYACIESDEDITTENSVTKRKREKKNLYLPLFKKPKYDRSFKNETSYNNINDNNIINAACDRPIVSDNNRSFLNNILECLNDNAMSEPFASVNHDDV